MPLERRLLLQCLFNAQRIFPNVDASMDAQSPLFDRAPRSGQMAACTQARCKLLLDLEACQLF